MLFIRVRLGQASSFLSLHLSPAQILTRPKFRSKHNQSSKTQGPKSDQGWPGHWAPLPVRRHGQCPLPIRTFIESSRRHISRAFNWQFLSWNYLGPGLGLMRYDRPASKPEPDVDLRLQVWPVKIKKKKIIKIKRGVRVPIKGLNLIKP